MASPVELMSRRLEQLFAKSAPGWVSSLSLAVVLVSCLVETVLPKPIASDQQVRARRIGAAEVYSPAGVRIATKG
jgi:hypothetical protein